MREKIAEMKEATAALMKAHVLGGGDGGEDNDVVMGDH